ncbi:MAG: GDP-mannose 4,6-dehydratase, partial [Crocinitomicaceae bacterium]
MNAFHQIYKDKTVLVTGHSGFKGSWLCRWLEHLGAKVVGLSLLDGVNEDHHKLLQPSFQSISCDIRDFNKTKALFNSLKPDAVFHLAAQALVIDSYHFPVETYATNVMGTLHVLEAARSTQSVKACVIVTSDKCYENNEWICKFKEIVCGDRHWCDGLDGMCKDLQTKLTASDVTYQWGQSIA